MILCSCTLPAELYPNAAIEAPSVLFALAVLLRPPDAKLELYSNSEDATGVADSFVTEVPPFLTEVLLPGAVEG